uniref:Uncharacterized protein n=1 Tax=Arundo donax TaxID=35708 RepID=A0A0A9EK77_ARUDO
MGGGSVDPP